VKFSLFNFSVHHYHNKSSQKIILSDSHLSKSKTGINNKESTSWGTKRSQKAIVKQKLAWLYTTKYCKSHWFARGLQGLHPFATFFICHKIF